MNYDVDERLKAFPNIRTMLEGVPRDLWDIFLPTTADKLPQLETRIYDFVLGEPDREKVMSIQRLCEFPLRPNASLSETMAKARIQGMKKAKLLDRFKREDDQTPQ